MRARVTLQSPTRVADEIGGAALFWSDAAEIWAEIEAQRADLRPAHDGASAEASFRVTINRREDVRAGWRILWDERVLRIIGIIDDGAPRVALVCAEVLP